MTTDDVLAKLGLQTRRTARDYLLPAVGLFGTGLVVGAGVALLLAPKSGASLRRDIGRTARHLQERAFSGNGRGVRNVSDDSQDLEEMTREQLHDRARERGIPARAEMSKPELIEALRSS